MTSLIGVSHVDNHFIYHSCIFWESLSTPCLAVSCKFHGWLWTSTATLLGICDVDLSLYARHPSGLGWLLVRTVRKPIGLETCVSSRSGSMINVRTAEINILVFRMMAHPVEIHQWCVRFPIFAKLSNSSLWWFDINFDKHMSELLRWREQSCLNEPFWELQSHSDGMFANAL